MPVEPKVDRYSAIVIGDVALQVLDNPSRCDLIRVVDALGALKGQSLSSNWIRITRFTILND